MSADLSDIVARLQASLAQQNTNPSFAGLQAPVDPTRTANLLNSLRQQQFLQQNNQPTQGANGWGFLHDAGKAAITQAGQGLGNFLANALGAAPGQQQQQAQAAAQQPAASGQAGDPTAGTQASPTPTTPISAYNGAIVRARQAYAAQVNNGVDPTVAKINALKMLVTAGVPGADTQLESASDALDKQAATKAGAAKDTAQAANYANESDNRDKTQSRETKAATWNTTYTDPNGFFQIQTNGLGEHKRVELQPNIASLIQANPEQESQIAAAIKAGQMPPLSGAALRTPSGMRIMALVTSDGTYDSTQFAAKAKAMNSFAPGGSNAKTVNSMNVALSHLDTLGNAADALGNGDVKGVNKVGNAISAWTGGTAPTDFEGIKGIVGDELTKAIIGSGGALADREEMKKTLDAANSPAQLKSVINRYQSLLAGQLAGQRTQYENATGRPDFEQRFLEPRTRNFAHSATEYTSVFPNTQQGAGGQSVTGRNAVPPPLSNAGGGKLVQDAKGNYAYRMPDGSFQPVK